MKGKKSPKIKKGISLEPPVILETNLGEDANQGIGIETQKLTISDETTFNKNQLQGSLNKSESPPSNLFIPDDASSIVEAEDETPYQVVVLSKEILAAGLSNLGNSACGTKHVFLNLTLPGYGMQDISLLTSFVHLQNVNLSYNNLNDISVFSNMRYLVKLDVSHNNLSTLLNFTPPYSLREVNFSYNQIKEINNLSDFRHLNRLEIEHNAIESIQGLSECDSLLHLNLAYNQIENVKGLDNLNIRKLHLSHNRLTSIENLESLTQLQDLNLSGNNISSLQGLSKNRSLQIINLEENQISDLQEIHNIDMINTVSEVNLLENPITHTEDYRKCVIFAMQQLTVLDKENVSIDEKVAAINLFAPPPEVQAALDHITHTVYRFLQPSKIYESTLPSIEMPYPMLVLTGPQASGKRELAHRLAQEFPDYFGFGVSHTTRLPYPGEIDGKDYHFVAPDQFQTLVRQGCFIQTFKHGGCLYGLTLDAIENVAKEGLACVVHMEINGLRTLKNTYFEPRYVLILPVNKEIHTARMFERGVYNADQIRHATINQSNIYKVINQDNPGFFDMVINSNKLGEAYDRLRQLVMDYLGTSDLTFGDEVQQPRLSTNENKDETMTQHTALSANMRRSWSRPSFQAESNNSNDGTSVKHKLSSRRTPVEEASYRRRQNAAIETVKGFSPSMYDEIFRRPLVPMTAPGMLEGSPMAQAASLYQDPAFAASMYPNISTEKMETSDKNNTENGNSDNTKTYMCESPDSSNVSRLESSGLSGLSSARGFSDQVSGHKKVANIEQPLDLTALSDALGSLKGSMKDSSRASTPLTPRLNQNSITDWFENNYEKPMSKTGQNVKPILPPIPNGSF